MSIGFSISSTCTDFVIKTAVGAAIGALNQANVALWALIFGVQSIASVTFNKIANVCFGQSLNNRVRFVTIADYSRFASHLVALALLQYTGLIALRVAGMFGFFAFTYLLANRVGHANASHLAY